MGINQQTFLVKLFIFLISIISLSIGICVLYFEGLNAFKIISYLLLINSVSLIYLYRKNIPIMLVWGFITYSNYSIVMGEVFSPNSRSLFSSLKEDASNIIGLMCLLLFTIVIIILTLFLYDNRELDFITYTRNENNIIASCIIVILFLIFIFGFQRPDALGERGTPSALYEYSSIFFIIGIYYTRKKSIFEKIYIIIAILFCIQNFKFGGRIIGLQIIFILFLMLYQKKLNIAKFFLISITGIIFMTGLGIMRDKYIQNDSIVNLLLERKFSLDTAIAAYFTSQTFILYKAMTTTQEQLTLLYNFIISLFTGGDRGVSSNLSLITREIFIHQFGGVFPIWFYYWLGYLGVILAGVVTYLFTVVIQIKNSNFAKLLAIFIFSTTPRWYLYSPTNLFRSSMLFLIVYIFVKFIHYLTQKNIRKSRS
ncbi:hypothetical protein [Vagococcus intermedius]|uniref:O-antigen polysaccharide polymerase Wzy n=1 Tax=Vagococcus intermedius TaxID=2991418 RepID=A0AAF0I6T7_9ENTE|nr:hypothetical protein [Vagococcus intermedius]WEG73798.1 hypothetical protein OL234_02485 [Vagococcus intermedius]WEG75883.1 hypothetical protein OL235_02495 [Vagococcus intermedius]